MILLDTHTLLWWAAEPDRLPAKAARTIGAALRAGEGLHASAMSAWEIAMLAQRKRLAFTMPAAAWLAHLERIPSFRFVPVDAETAMRAVDLDFAHKDPADRLIVATAMGLGATLVTGDAKLRAYKPVKTVWD